MKTKETKLCTTCLCNHKGDAGCSPFEVRPTGQLAIKLRGEQIKLKVKQIEEEAKAIKVESSFFEKMATRNAINWDKYQKMEKKVERLKEQKEYINKQRLGYVNTSKVQSDRIIELEAEVKQLKMENKSMKEKISRVHPSWLDK